MDSPQILKSILSSSFSISQSKSLRKSRCFCSEFNSKVAGKRISNRSSKLVLINKRVSVCCKVQGGDSKSNGEEPPESLFMKELKKRGMTPTSLLEESNRRIYSNDEDIRYREEDGGFTNRNFVSTDVEKSLSNQRERSMALNSEGLEGLVPRAKLLLTIGGSFFLGFWQLIFITIALFCALYLYFGATFVHDGTDPDTPVAPPPYVDPYALLEDERISQTAPRLR